MEQEVACNALRVDPQASVFDRVLQAQIISNLTLARFLCKTPVAEEFLVQLEEWVTAGFAGALVYAWFRLGKTCGVLWALKQLSEFLGFHVGFMRVSARDGLPSERLLFFRHLLKCTNNRHAATVRGETNVRDALEDFLVVEALKSPIRTFIMFIDEAQVLNKEQCLWLRELDNDVSERGCRLFLLPEGDMGLPALRKYLIDEGKEQCVARSMSGEYMYRGLRTEEELTEMLNSLTELEVVPNTGYNIKTLFRSVGGIELDVPSLGKTMWAEFSRQWKDAGLGDLELGMHYACLATSLTCTKTQKLGWRVQPGDALVRQAINGCGLMQCIEIRLAHTKNPPSRLPTAAVRAMTGQHVPRQ